MITEAETKEIEDEARDISVMRGQEDKKQAILSLVTRMAEKKNEEIKLLKLQTLSIFDKENENLHLKAQLEAAQTTLEKYRAAVEDRINEKEDLMWQNQKLQAELERVKAVAEKMVRKDLVKP